MPVTILAESLGSWLATEWDAAPIEVRKLFTGGGKEYEIVSTLADGTRVRIDVKEIISPWG